MSKTQRLVLWVFYAAFSVLILGAAAQVMVSDRTLGLQSELTSNSGIDGDAVTLLGRLVSLVVLGLSVNIVFLRLAGAIKIKYRKISAIQLSYLMFFLAVQIVNAIGGTVPGLNYQSLYGPALFFSLALLPAINSRHLVNSVKLLFLALVILSLLFVFIDPDLVLESNYIASVVGFQYRLYGLTDHANTLGLVGVVIILLEVAVPIKSRLRWGVLVPALIAIIFAQSKTVWITLLVLVYILVASKRLSLSHSKLVGTRRLSYARLIKVSIFFSMVAGFAFNFLDIDSLSSAGGKTTDLSTFTGRDYIWDITIREWLNNPVFGYGPSLWGEAFRQQVGLASVGQAHNQYVQTLGEAGLFGMFFLVLYQVVLLISAIRLNRTAGVLPLCLLLVLWIRCFSESPFRIGVLLDVGTVVHLLLFLLLLNEERHRDGLKLGRATTGTQEYFDYSGVGRSFRSFG